jgi:hypothetical protein
MYRILATANTVIPKESKGNKNSIIKELIITRLGCKDSKSNEGGCFPARLPKDAGTSWIMK